MVAQSSFRVGRRRVLATAVEALGRWAVQLGILPRAEGGTQEPAAKRLAGLMAEPACALPLAGLGPSELVALRERRLHALGSADAMLVEMAALASAVTLLCDLHGLPWANPLAAAAEDGIRLIDADGLAALRAHADDCGPAIRARLDLALACGAGLSEVESLTAGLPVGEPVWLPLRGRSVQIPAMPPGATQPLPACAFRQWLAHQHIAEASLRLTALAGRLDRGSHLDEAFLLAGCGLHGCADPVRIPWFG